jgi:hypothetical protein
MGQTAEYPIMIHVLCPNNAKKAHSLFVSHPATEVVQNALCIYEILTKIDLINKNINIKLKNRMLWK